MPRYLAESERLALVPLGLEEHLDDFLDMNLDVRLVKFLHRDSFTTLEGARTHLLSRLKSEESPDREPYAILLKSEVNDEGRMKMVGSIGIPRVPRFGEGEGGVLEGNKKMVKGRVEVGYGINPRYWGKGYAPEAVRMFLGYYWGGEREGEMRDTIVAYTALANVPSQRVLEKVGFKKDKVVERAYEAVDMESEGREMKWWPAVIWRLGREEFEGTEEKGKV